MSYHMKTGKIKAARKHRRPALAMDDPLAREEDLMCLDADDTTELESISNEIAPKDLEELDAAVAVAVFNEMSLSWALLDSVAVTKKNSEVGPTETKQNDDESSTFSVEEVDPDCDWSCVTPSAEFQVENTDGILGLDDDGLITNQWEALSEVGSIVTLDTAMAKASYSDALQKGGLKKSAARKGPINSLPLTTPHIPEHKTLTDPNTEEPKDDETLMFDAEFLRAGAKYSFGGQPYNYRSRRRRRRNKK